ncbi:SusC/RagA family TonB-linked outer membrane protein [Bacteroides stercorirosoris]|uniref:Iron complex outermembrane recepter protein n=1 Tax=Bacteroides stercorirosoris TaxID=871324 RepID=A0A1M6AF73_9BACE|nr:TonB-dependent receptor [Bacteroides stercorirosoris]SHI35186.1 iron complex outermembrane recepter protein [Bacteroides stercorirosoris]
MKRKAIYTLCSLFILFMMTGLCETATAQNITATGKVVDKNQEPLIGATVRIVGAQGGTITGMDGDFSLSCPSNSTLEISFVGYISQKVNAGTRLSIVLQEDAIALEETVIVGVGYGTMRKSDLTGAITSVNAKDMKQGIITSAEQLLQGKVAGLSVVQSSGAPEAGASIRLRGGTSLSASNGPLVVVDGIPGVDFNSVQPSEIVSIDVLKDASAAAIYGSRGANGVIIVTTNRAASDTEQKSIQYNGYVAIGQVAKHMDLLSADQWRAYVRENNVGQAIDYGADTDWQKELERTAISHSHNVAISNSRKDNGYRASITYQNNQGVIVRNSMNRLAGSLAAYQTGWNGRLRIEAGINANFDSWHPIDNRIFERMTNLNPTFPVYDQNGDFAQIGGTNTENPVEINANRADDRKRHRFLGYGKVELDLVKGLKAVANGSYEYQSTEGGLYKPTYAMMEGKSEKGWGQRTYAKYTNKQIETYLNYDLELARIHRMNFMAGYSYLINVYDGFGSSRSGFDTDAFLYNNLAAGSDFRAGDVYSYKGEAKLASFFGRINYNLMGKYMLTATLRRDGSSRFGANHKWGTFPSVSLAWRISDETFMESTTSWLNNLKLRAGYGVTGNQAGIGEYKSLAVLSADGASYYDAASGTWKKSYVQAQNVNPNLKWESTAQLNIGLDFGIFNRINGTIEFYHKKTSDLLWTYPVPQPPYQVGTMLANVGDLVNKGIEVSLSANILRQKDLTLDANVTFAYNDQEITKLSNDAYQAVGLQAGSLHGLRGMSGMYSQIIKEGYPSGAFYGPKCSGIDSDGNYIINRDEDGKPINEYLGSAQPKFNLGFGMNLTYRDFDFSFAGYGMFGQKVLNATRMAMFDPTRLPAQNVPDDFLESGIKSDPVFSSYFVENGSFFRLQSVTLGYTLPGVKKIGLEKIRFYLTGENLFCITGYSGIDPEVSLPDNVLEGPGIDRFNSYPRPRTFSLGVNISF